MSSTIAFIDRYRNCPLCSSTEIVPAHTIRISSENLTWDRCENCTLVFQNPRLSEASIRALYIDTDYFGRQAQTNFAAYKNYIQRDPIRIEQSRLRIKRIMRAGDIGAGRLLDVGSATGFFGVAAREAGFDVTCIEPDTELASYGVKNYGLTFMNNSLETCSLPHEWYDVVTLWGTYAVLLHPLRSFEQLALALKPGGLLAMNVQDFDHWIRKIFPRLMVGWNVGFNLSSRSLNVLMQKLDFTIINKNMEWQLITLDHLFRVLRIYGPSFLRPVVVKIPAVSFPVVLARKRG